jgi:hypothetical protein
VDAGGSIGESGSVKVDGKFSIKYVAVVVTGV